MATVTLLRHGETDFNKKQIIQGRFDIPLNEYGKLQASKTAAHFKENVDVIISSPLIRAYETAKIIANEIDYQNEIMIDHTFIERDFGEADGKDVKEYIELVHQDCVNHMERESEIQSRMIKGILSVCEKHKDQNILIVCHAHSIKAVLSALNPKDYNFKTILRNCSITKLDYQNNELLIKKVNYNDYLEK